MERTAKNIIPRVKNEADFISWLKKNEERKGFVHPLFGKRIDNFSEFCKSRLEQIKNAGCEISYHYSIESVKRVMWAAHWLETGKKPKEISVKHWIKFKNQNR